MARPKSMEARKMVSLPAGLAEQVEDYRFENRLKTEADAIRRLIQLGLETAKGGSHPVVQADQEIVELADAAGKPEAALVRGRRAKA